MLISGQMIGRFEVKSKLGQGGMGSVYKGKDTQLGIEVAIKEIDEQVAAHKVGIESFKAEAKLAITLRHPNIVGFVGYEEVVSGGTTSLYLITQLVSGRPLQDFVDDMNRTGVYFAPARVLQIMKQVLAGLGYAHSHGVIHRDIKPSNVMLDDATGMVTLIDFGIARNNAGSSQKTQFLASGAFSPYYSPPEQVMGTGTLPCSDVYSCAILVYELLTGKVKNVVPIDSRTRLANDPLTQFPFISPELEKVLLRAVAVSQVDRYAAAADFSAALELAVSSGGFFTPPQPPTSPLPPPQSTTGPTTRRTAFDIRKK